MYANRTTEIQKWIDLAQLGDQAARDQLVTSACDRLRQLTHRMLVGDRLRRWEETDDVLQQAAIRLHRELEKLRPATVRDFLRLAAFQIRRVMVDLARHYYGPRGLGTNQTRLHDVHITDAVGDGRRSCEELPSHAVERQEQWESLYDAISRLPADEREVVELLWLHELTQIEAMTVLDVDVRTVQRRWARARITLSRILGSERAQLSIA